MIKKIVSIREKKTPIIPENSNVQQNLEYARKWYKTKKWLHGMRIRTSNCGSSNGGFIKNGLLEISYKSPFGCKILYADLVQSIFLGDSHESFVFEIDKVYRTIYDQAQRIKKRTDAI